MEHHFNVDLAKKYGIEEAIIIDMLYTWIHVNECNEEMFKNGRTWCYSTAKAFTKYLPYMSSHKIRRILLKLEEKGFIVIGNFNKSGMNQTLWYAFTDQAIKELKEQNYDFAKMQNGICKSVKSECNKKECNKEKINKKSTIVDEKEKKDEGDTVDSYVGENGEISFLPPAEDEKEKLYLAWVSKEFPRMMKMQVPLSYKCFKELRDKYGEELVISKMEALDNDKRYYQKKIDAYRTLNNWLRSDTNKDAA